MNTKYIRYNIVNIRFSNWDRSGLCNSYALYLISPSTMSTTSPTTQTPPQAVMISKSTMTMKSPLTGVSEKVSVTTFRNSTSACISIPTTNMVIVTYHFGQL